MEGKSEEDKQDANQRAEKNKDNVKYQPNLSQRMTKKGKRPW